jgi:hypothetical protein
VIVPYAEGLLHDRVVPSITRQGYSPTLIRCVNTVGHPDSYPMILRQYLLGEEDVVIVEHDNESRPGFLASYEECPEPWCFHAYDFGPQTWEQAIEEGRPDSAPMGSGFAALGHTRFRAGFCEPIRSTLESDFFARSWVSRDTFVAGALNLLGFSAHRHEGKSVHHHPYEDGTHPYQQSGEG